MRLAMSKGFFTFLRSDLAMLVLASMACVVVLTIAIVDGGGNGGIEGLRLSHLLVFAILAGAAGIAGAVVWRAIRYARRIGQKAVEETTILRRNLATTEAIINAEPQLLIFWEKGKGLQVVTHTLTSVPGLPLDANALLNFGAWLDWDAARALKGGLDGLFRDGRPFNVLLRTCANGHVEADGHAAGGRAILRFRDVAEYKRDLVKILDQHRSLSRDVVASRALLNALPNPVWLKNAEGRIAWVNKAYTRAVEASDEAEVRRSQIELLESRQRADAERSLADGKTYRQRMALIAGGERRTHDVVMLPLEGATVAAATDVTELESARGDLDREIAAYDRTLHRVATATAIFGPDQRLTFFNEAYLKLWALDADWLKTQPSDGEILDRLRDLSRLPNALPYREWKARLLACYGKQRQHEDSWHLPDGRTLHVIAEQRPDGGVTYLYDDVTERIALESRFNELIDVQRETLDHLQEGVALFATDGRLRLFNSAFAQIWKLSRRALGEGPHVDDLIAQCSILFDHPPTWHIIQRAVTGISDTRSPYADQMVRPDASVIDFAVLPLPDGATLITFADVTAAKSYERALIERNEALVAADRLKSQFISHVSYELRTPLTNIIGFSELLESPRTGDLNAKQREYLGDITASSKTLLAIIDDILDLATMDAGTLELRLSDVDVNAVVEAAVLGVRERAMRSRIQLDIAIAPGIATFQGDENRVRQILYNLLSNAIGFSKAGSAVRLHVSADDAMIHFRVCDNGVGIPKDQQARVFERFESRSHGSNHRGAGLGLSVVKSLVELHGGTMTLQSEPGEGTSITAHLPLEGARRTPRPEDHDALAATQPLPSLQQAHALAQAASDTSVAALNQRVAQMAERAAQPAAATQPVEPPSSPSQAETSGPVLIASMPLDDAANG